MVLMEAVTERYRPSSPIQSHSFFLSSLLETYLDRGSGCGGGVCVCVFARARVRVSLAAYNSHRVFRSGPASSTPSGWPSSTVCTLHIIYLLCLPLFHMGKSCYSIVGHTA